MPTSYNSSTIDTTFSGAVYNLDITAEVAPPDTPDTEAHVLTGCGIIGGGKLY
jgi:hypothetical protein